jgi:Ran GTPase-activating protein (RanGAP) involved in mRNA processing and transport
MAKKKEPASPLSTKWKVAKQTRDTRTLVDLQHRAARIDAACVALKRNDPSTQSVELARAKLQLDDIQELRKALQPNCHLKLLDISHNALCMDCAHELGHVMTEDTSLESICLQGNHLGGAGAAIFASYFNRAIHLRVLNMSGNIMGDPGVKAVAMALSNNKTIEEVDLGSNEISDGGVVKLARMLQQNCVIRSLGLTGNLITSVGGSSLISMIKENPVIERIDLHLNNVSIEVRQRITARLADNKRSGGILLGLGGGANSTFAMGMAAMQVRQGTNNGAVEDDRPVTAPAALSDSKGVTFITFPPVTKSHNSQALLANAQILIPQKKQKQKAARPDNPGALAARGLNDQALYRLLDASGSDGGRLMGGGGAGDEDDGGVGDATRPAAIAVARHSHATAMDLSVNTIGPDGAKLLASRTVPPFGTLVQQASTLGTARRLDHGKGAKTEDRRRAVRIHGTSGSSGKKAEASAIALANRRGSVGDNGGDGGARETGITSLNLAHNNVGDEGLAYLCTALAEHPDRCSLTTLLLTNNNITGGAPKPRRRKSVGIIDGQNASFQSVGADSGMLTGGSRLTGGFASAAASTAAAASASRRRSSAHTKNAAIKAAMAQPACYILEKALRLSHTLTALDLAHNNLGDKGAIACVNGLRPNFTLTRLSLAANGIGDEGATALAGLLIERSTEYLEQKTMWKTVHAYHACTPGGRAAAVQLIDTGAVAGKSPTKSPNRDRASPGGRASPSSPKKGPKKATMPVGWGGGGGTGPLETVNFAGNPVGREGVLALLGALQTTMLIRVDLKGCDAQRSATLAKAEALAAESALQEMVVTRMAKYGNAEGPEIREARKSARKLKKVWAKCPGTRAATVQRGKACAWHLVSRLRGDDPSMLFAEFAGEKIGGASTMIAEQMLRGVAPGGNPLVNGTVLTDLHGETVTAGGGPHVLSGKPVVTRIASKPHRPERPHSASTPESTPHYDPTRLIGPIGGYACLTRFLVYLSLAGKREWGDSVEEAREKWKRRVRAEKKHEKELALMMDNMDFGAEMRPPKLEGEGDDFGSTDSDWGACCTPAAARILAKCILWTKPKGAGADDNAGANVDGGGGGFMDGFTCVCPSLTVLDVSGNRLGFEDAMEPLLKAGVLGNKSLIRLAVGGNEVGDAGCKIIEKGLKKNITLTSLELASAMVGEEGTKCLAKGIAHNHTLVELDLSSQDLLQLFPTDDEENLEDEMMMEMAAEAGGGGGAAGGDGRRKSSVGMDPAAFAPIKQQESSDDEEEEEEEDPNAVEETFRGLGKGVEALCKRIIMHHAMEILRVRDACAFGLEGKWCKMMMHAAYRNETKRQLDLPGFILELGDDIDISDSKMSVAELNEFVIARLVRLADPRRDRRGRLPEDLEDEVDLPDLTALQLARRELVHLIIAQGTERLLGAGSSGDSAKVKGMKAMMNRAKAKVKRGEKAEADTVSNERKAIARAAKLAAEDAAAAAEEEQWQRDNAFTTGWQKKLVIERTSTDNRVFMGVGASAALHPGYRLDFSIPEVQRRMGLAENATGKVATNATELVSAKEHFGRALATHDSRLEHQLLKKVVNFDQLLALLMTQTVGEGPARFVVPPTQRLHKLNIQTNDILNLPAELGLVCQELHTLKVDFCKLMYLPRELSLLNGTLLTFTVEGCKSLQDPPQEIVVLGRDDILKYLMDPVAYGYKPSKLQERMRAQMDRAQDKEERGVKKSADREKRKQDRDKAREVRTRAILAIHPNTYLLLSLCIPTTLIFLVTHSSLYSQMTNVWMFYFCRR